MAFFGSFPAGGNRISSVRFRVLDDQPADRWLVVGYFFKLSNLFMREREKYGRSG